MANASVRLNQGCLMGLFAERYKTLRKTLYRPSEWVFSPVAVQGKEALAGFRQGAGVAAASIN
jgi:hypothetical protein